MQTDLKIQSSRNPLRCIISMAVILFLMHFVGIVWGSRGSFLRVGSYDKEEGELLSVFSVVSDETAPNHKQERTSHFLSLSMVGPADPDEICISDQVCIQRPGSASPKSNRIHSPIPAPFLRIALISPRSSPQVTEKQILGYVSPGTTPRERRRSLSSSPETRLDHIVAEIEEAITPELIEGILSFPVFAFDGAVYGPGLARIKAAARMLHLGEDEQFPESDKVLLFLRMGAELLVEVDNLKYQTRELLDQAKPFIECLLFLCEKADLAIDFARKDSIDLILGVPVKSTGVGSLESLVFLLDNEADSDAPPITVQSRVFQELHLVHLRTVSDSPLLRHFCKEHAENLIERMAEGVESIADPRITRVAIDLVTLCKRAISFQSRFSHGLPMLLQSAIGRVADYEDGDVLFRVPQGPDMLDTLLESMVTFDKLELMNEVYVSFTDSEAAGYDGLRRQWLSSAISEMARNASLFEFTDGRKLFLKPRNSQGQNNEKFRMFGRLVGLALRYGVSPGVPLSPSCLYLLQHGKDDVEIASLKLFLTQEDPQYIVSFRAMQLMDDSALREFSFPDGETVTTTNLDRFVAMRMRQLTLDAVREPMLHITAGVADTVRFVLIESLDPRELRDLIHGAQSISVPALRAETTWSVVMDDLFIVGGTSEPSQVTWLFEILASSSLEEMKKFLSFVSGASLPPIGGFVPENEDRGWLQVIIDPYMSEDKLPTSQTCFVSIRIPMYDTKEELEHKLRLAIDLALTIEYA